MTLDNLDKRLKYYHLVLRLPAEAEIPAYPLPEGFSFTTYADGDRDTWIAIEQSAKEFDRYEQGLEAWERYYARYTDRLPGRMQFIESPNGEKVATATAFFDPEAPDGDGWLHWVSVRRDMQGKGLARPLIAHTLRRLRALGYGEIFVSTQTTTWVAARLYMDFGFRPTEENLQESLLGWRILKTLTNHPALAALEPVSEAEMLVAPKQHAQIIKRDKLGRIEKVEDLRSVWPHEAYDFSKWLSQEENLALLSDTIGINITLEELESPVGGFNVDLFATEEGTTRRIIIENQLEETNHDHLGKIITYASGKSADVIIWIVKRARDEHTQAIQWLNQHTDENIGFFLLEIELWKIDNSPLAPKFNIVERPNDWAKTMKATEGLSETKRLQFEFWQSFVDYAFSKPEIKSVFSKRKAQPQNWYSLGIGSSIYHLDLSVNTQKNQLCAAIYIQGDKPTFEKFRAHQTEIEDELQMKLDWVVANKDCCIRARRNGDIKKNRDNWPSFFDWYCKMLFSLRKIAGKYGT